MEENKKKKNKTIILILVSFAVLCTIGYYILVGFVIFSIDNDTALIEYKNNIIEINKGELTIENSISGKIINDSYIIDGYIKNNTEKDISFINITFDVNDINGNVLGTATSSIDMLKSHKTWKFKAIYYDFDYQDAVNFDLTEIEYY